MAPNKKHGKNKGPGGSKRAKEAAAAPGTAKVAPPPALTAEEKQQQARDLQRSQHVLFLLLKRQRQAARDARLAKRLSRPVLTSDDEWALNGSGDDDGEQGAVTGGGWHIKEVIDFVSLCPVGGKFRFRGGGDDAAAAAAVAASAADPSADRAFAETCAAAARACKAWRAVVLRASDRLAVYIDGEAKKNVPSTSGAWQCEPASVLRACARGGILRALWVRGEQIDPAKTANAVRDLACAMGVTKPTPRHPGPETQGRLADLLRGLRVLKVDSTADVVSALLTLPLCSPLPTPPLLSSVVDLTLDDYPSTYASRDRPFFFSRLHLPSLRALSVRLHKDSDCPLEIARGGGASGDDPALLPPAITRLRAARQKSKHPAFWTLGEPLQVSQATLAALAPTLRVLWADRVYPSPGSVAGQTGGNLRRPRPVGDLAEFLREHAFDTDNGPPPSDLAPMRRLVPCLSPLTSLSALRLNSDMDWSPAPVFLAAGGFVSPYLAASLQGARMQELHSAARAVLQPLAPALRRLELKDGEALLAHGLSVFLPPALSVLSGLTCLEIKAKAIVGSTAPIAALTNLRRLSLEARDAAQPRRPPPLSGGELASLRLLEHLCLSEPPASIATVLRSGLPRLSSLVLWAGPLRRPAPEGPGQPPLGVLRAALARQRRGTDVFFVAGVDDGEPPRRMRADELATLIAEFQALSEDDDDTDSGERDEDEEEDEDEDADEDEDEGEDEDADDDELPQGLDAAFVTATSEDEEEEDKGAPGGEDGD